MAAHSPLWGEFQYTKASHADAPGGSDAGDPPLPIGADVVDAKNVAFGQS